MKVRVHSAEVVTVQVPFRFVKRGGRKEMVLPEGMHLKKSSVDGTVIKALARAFRWKRMLESGEFATISDLAAHERIAPTYMTRVMRLTLLAPEIVEGIVAGHGEKIGLTVLMEPCAAEWAKQPVRDLLAQHGVGGQPDGVEIAPHFEPCVDRRHRIGGIGSKEAHDVTLGISGDHRVQDLLPAVGAVDIAVPQLAALQHTELVEQKERKVACAVEMPFLGGAC